MRYLSRIHKLYGSVVKYEMIILTEFRSIIIKNITKYGKRMVSSDAYSSFSGVPNNRSLGSIPGEVLPVSFLVG